MIAGPIVSGQEVFFVMLRMGDGRPEAMVDDDDRVALFDSYEEADDAAGRNPLGGAFGWDIYPWRA